MRDKKTGRPEPCAQIYKYGRLKTRKEMDADGTADRAAMRNMPESIKNKSFDELMAESKPVSQETIDAIKKLVDGIEVNLDEPLSGGGGLLCWLGLHRWWYGGKKRTWSDGSYSIFATRYCSRCEKRQEHSAGLGERVGWHEEKIT